jgi:hypothetical protein
MSADRQGLLSHFVAAQMVVCTKGMRASGAWFTGRSKWKVVRLRNGTFAG